jgi:hypothetical protein
MGMASFGVPTCDYSVRRSLLDLNSEDVVKGGGGRGAGGRPGAVQINVSPRER